MADNVIKVQFGAAKEARESRERFDRLQSLVQMRQAAILSDPQSFLDAIYADYAKLRQSMFEATQVLRLNSALMVVPPDFDFERTMSVTIRKDDYEHLKRLEEIIEGWI